MLQETTKLMVCIVNYFFEKLKQKFPTDRVNIRWTKTLRNMQKARITYYSVDKSRFDTWLECVEHTTYVQIMAGYDDALMFERVEESDVHSSLANVIMLHGWPQIAYQKDLNDGRSTPVLRHVE